MMRLTENLRAEVYPVTARAAGEFAMAGAGSEHLVSDESLQKTTYVHMQLWGKIVENEKASADDVSVVKTDREQARGR